MERYPQLISVAVIVSALTACGGGSGSSAAPTAPVTPVTPTTPVTPPADTRPDWIKLAGACENPRTGVSLSGVPYPDRQGSATDELKWVRSFIDETYLWYREVPTNLRMEDYRYAYEYFPDLKTPALTASGRPKDRYHFMYDTATWEALSQSSVEMTYGVAWASSDPSVLPRVWQVMLVEPQSPADVAGVKRGDTLVSVDGVSISDNTNEGVDVLNAGLAPQSGAPHSFVLLRGGASVAVSMAARDIVTTPVQNVRVLDTPTGKVGYLLFNDHNAVSETQLIDAFGTLKAGGVTDLVLDMRYNGGGLLNIAGELAYMIAGPAATSGKVFLNVEMNDKLGAQEPVEFRTTAFGYAPSTPSGTVLPYLGLRRVTVLATEATCSASEAVVTGLRGVDVEVNLIGSGTCGKPYGFVPEDNCGITYFAVQMQLTNHKGFGDYADGLAPTCSASDDLSRQLGDPAEGMLETALRYRSTGVCPATPMRRAAVAPALRLVRPQAKEIAIIER